MTSDSVPLFLNPTAGRGRAGRHAQKILALLHTCGIDAKLIESQGVGDLEQKVFEEANRTAGPLIVAGGDGSVHEAVNGILRAHSHAPLGVIPLGTGNDFAKASAIPLDWENAARLLGRRLADNVQARTIDAGIMNDRYFANGVGIGFDAKVNRIARRYRWPVGDLVYLLAVLEGIWDGVITPSVRMRWTDGEYTGNVTLANISNGAWVGGMFYIAPNAENDDGALDLVYAEPVTRTRVLSLLPKLIRGTHIDEPDVYSHRIESFELSADAPVPSHLDGEVQPLQSEFRIGILKGALSLA